MSDFNFLDGINSLTKYPGFLGSKFPILKNLKVRFFQKSLEIIATHLFLFWAHILILNQKSNFKRA